MAIRPDEFAPDAFFLSAKVPHSRLDQIAAGWELVKSTEEPRIEHRMPPPAPRTAPYTFVSDLDPTAQLLWSRRYGAVTSVPVQVFRERTSVAFDLPVRIAGGGRFKVNLRSDSLASLPKRDVTAGLVVQHSRWRDDGLELLMSAWPHYRVVLKLPTLRQVAEAILTQSVRSWAMSDKGRLADSLSGNSEVQLLTPGLFEVIRALTTRRSSHLLKELERREFDAGERDRAEFVAQIGGRLERRSQSARDVGNVDPSQRVRLLELLVRLGWAERGLRIVCRRCGITSFIAARDVSPGATCPGCSSTQDYISTDAGPTTHYRLNSLVDLASDQGAIPHLMAAEALFRTTPDSFIFPGVDCELLSGEKAEVDLFGIHGDKVVAGEAKISAGEFSEVQMRRDISLSKALGADVHLVVCIQSLNDQQRSLAADLASAESIELLMLDGQSLRPA